MISAKRLYISSCALLLLVLGAAQYASAQAVRVPRPSQKAIYKASQEKKSVVIPGVPKGFCFCT